ncbi:MAG: DoxX family protein, partial [Proteobacteria bacterium]|nr:DoxX family protein [Pseudomonadota bacterium]
LAMALNLWLGLYSAPGEWPWTYFFLIVIQAWFAIDPPGRALGFDALGRQAPRMR